MNSTEENNQHFDMVRFLNVFETLPCLWLKSNQNYKNKVSRDAAEKYLIDEFKPIFKDKIELRRKIRNIRCTYNQEVKKIRKSITDSGAREVYKPRLSWFEEADRFLSRNFVDAPNLYCNIFKEENNDSATQETITADVENINNFMEEDEHQEKLIEMGLEDFAMERPSKRKRGDKTTLMEKEYQTRVLLKTVKVLEAVQQRMEEKTLSEFEVFADYVVKQLQELPRKEAIRLQLEIQTLITNTRLSLL